MKIKILSSSKRYDKREKEIVDKTHGGNGDESDKVDDEMVEALRTDSDYDPTGSGRKRKQKWQPMRRGSIDLFNYPNSSYPIKFLTSIVPDLLYFILFQFYFAFGLQFYLLHNFTFHSPLFSWLLVYKGIK